MKHVYFDLETGGLSEKQHPIIQIAAVAVDADFETIEEFERKIRFKESAATPKALKINSYEPEVWQAEAIEERSATEEFNDFLSRHLSIMKQSTKGNVYRLAQLAGHNVVKFDCPFLEVLFKKHGMFCRGTLYEPLDTLRAAHWVVPRKEVQNYKLGTLCAHFGIPLEGAHDALADVRANALLGKALMERMKRD